MARYKLIIAYNGTNYCGWQRQPDLMSVQEALEAGFKAFCGEDITVHAAGRTDAGVHASGQVAHVDLAKDWRTDVVRDAVNQHLLNERIAILSAEKVSDEFHARFSATGRSYIYKMLNRRSPPVFERGQVWHLKRKVDASAMDKAAKLLATITGCATPSSSARVGNDLPGQRFWSQPRPRIHSPAPRPVAAWFTRATISSALAPRSSSSSTM